MSEPTDSAPAGARPLYLDPDAPIEARVDDLVARMTLEEKISQMVHDAPAIERLGVPKYNWWNEDLHGVGRAGLATVFPQAIGLAATWDVSLMERIATAISDEARAKHHEAVHHGVREIYTGLTYWSPNINIFRDPRWGRGQETYGEDPYLTSRMGVAFVRGLQGNDPRYLKLVATAKHFAVHSGREADRHRFDARVSPRDLWDMYLPAFETLVREGQVVSVMGAYNRTNGEPCCASSVLLEEILRGKWGFAGYVVSDCWAIRDFFTTHQVMDTPAQAAALAVNRGCDLNCGETYMYLQEAVEQGLITEETITRSVKRLFEARFRLGMFDPPERVAYAHIPYAVNDCPTHRALALQAARESIVLLKNEGNLLPLRKDLASIAVIGPNADDVALLWGNYNGTPMQPVTPLEGIRAAVSLTTTVYTARGCDLAPGVRPLSIIPSLHLRPAEASPAQRGLSAAYYANPGCEGAPAFTRVDPNMDFVWKGTTPISGEPFATFSMRWNGYLVPPVSGEYELGASGLSDFRLLLDGEPLLEYRGIHHPVLQKRSVTLEAGRLYRLQLDYVNRSADPQMQLLWALPGADDAEQALEVARKADVAVLVLGISPALEGEEMPVEIEGFDHGDRTSLDLPRPQQELLERIHALGKPMVLVLLNGSALAVNWAHDHVPAIVEAWYPGQAGGTAIAEVLFGDVNPAGRLPVTFYRSLDDLPPFDDYAAEGHTYRYFRGQPLYPFGFGLSYTRFAYSNLRLGATRIRAGEGLAVAVDVQNVGERAGDEVVQLYVRDLEASVAVPIRSLQGFARIHLRPGEKETVRFTLAPSQFALVNEAGERVIEPGLFQIAVGGRQPTAEDERRATPEVLIATVEVTGQVTQAS